MVEVTNIWADILTEGGEIMPVYEYYCSGCNQVMEVEQRITEEPLHTCPRCGSRSIKKLISMTHFVLKGGGWYADGYSSKSEKSGGEGSKSVQNSAEKSTKGAAGETKK